MVSLYFASLSCFLLKINVDIMVIYEKKKLSAECRWSEFPYYSSSILKALIVLYHCCFFVHVLFMSGMTF